MSFFAGEIMEKEERKDGLQEEKKSIWRQEHTPLSERKTSSGVTFRCKEVSQNGQKYK